MDNNEYFSVNYQCSVNVQRLTESESVPDEVTFASEIPAPFLVSSEAAHIDSAALRSLRNIGEYSQDLAEYLKMQSRKIDVIMGYVLSLQDDASERFQTTSISGSAITYTSTKALNVGDHARLKIFLPEESVAIYAYAQVKAVEMQNDLYTISLDLIRMRETDQEHLIRATLHIQTRQLKERK
ncbi:PilZ domain-containing protein [Echinimonas agarilytica]|uniref:PilZ domain-containing protein n=1 Tax=Echinimonas agarilytica TaxID=1215918 RepID=A0AA41W785_9GAMM|nr:PilZ domain-containing protein [Echinimonas agarilytica]MCM2679937.1 PilZ domain-containing protein [Echinimonas agarilytica]